MPTYQYSCTECGHFFEQFQSFSEESLTVCPECEGRLRKVFNAVGVVFKGSGFYRTDSRSSSTGDAGSGSAKESGTTKETSPTSGSSGSTGGDSSSGSTTSSSGSSTGSTSSKKAGSAA